MKDIIESTLGTYTIDTFQEGCMKSICVVYKQRSKSYLWLMR